MTRSRNSRRYRFRVALLAWLGAASLRLLGATWRIRIEGDDPFAGGEPFVGAIWHRDLLAAAYQWRGRGVAVPVSLSRDGDLIDAVLCRLGYAAGPRGSSSRGATALLRESIRWLRGGRVLGILPDGPRGPAGQAKLGAVAIARVAGVPLVPVGLSAAPCIRFGSWDRALLPLPFARVICRYGRPLRVPKSTQAEGLERIRAELQATLDRLDRELDAEVGLPAVPPRSASETQRPAAR